MPAAPRPSFLCTIFSLLVLASVSHAADWNRFRGPNGSGISTDKQAAPVKWSDSKNLKWKVTLPGPGHSSPIVVGDRVLVTCWSGYGVEGNRGEQKDLKRHLICIDRKTGKEKWATAVDPVLPEDRYAGMFRQHGYASHTPASDGKRVYTFFGKTGVLAFDLEGEKLWQTSVGTGSGIRGWGTASSPILYKNLVIVNAAAESESLYALNKDNGEIVWKQDTEGYAGNWGTPVLVDVGDGRTDLVLGVPYEIWGLNPENGKLRWYCDGIDSDSMCTSVVAHGDVVYAVGGRSGGTIAVRAGGKGDVNKTHVVWRGNDRARISTPLVHEGRLYFVSNKIVNGIDTKNGKRIFQARLRGEGGSSSGGEGDGDRRRGGGRGGFGGGGGGFGGGGGQDYSSPVVADGKLYYFSRSGDGYVVKTGEKFELLSQNRLEDGGEFSATPAISEGQLFVRSTKYLYCIAETDDDGK